MPKNHYLAAKPQPQRLKWTLVARTRYSWLVEIAGKLMHVRFKPVRLKGKPRYTVPPDCDPMMW